MSVSYAVYFYYFIKKLDYVSAGWKEDETKHLLHIYTNRRLDSVRWNPANQDDVDFHIMHYSNILRY